MIATLKKWTARVHGGQLLMVLVACSLISTGTAIKVGSNRAAMRAVLGLEVVL